MSLAPQASMRTSTMLAALLTATLSGAAGCVADFGPEPDDESLGEGEYEALTKNALTKNALTDSALSQDPVTRHGLTRVRLTTSGIQASFSYGGVTYTKTHSLHPYKVLQTSSLSRTMFKYLYECAMPAGESMSVTYTISGKQVTKHFYGQLGFAPEWESGTCGTTCQRWVSACMISRLNSLGTQVDLSVRAEHDGVTAQLTWDELVQFETREASYFGNIFVEPMQMFACQDSETMLQDVTLPGRLCGDNVSDGSAECPVTLLGYCQRPADAPATWPISHASCVDAPAEIWYTSCRANSTFYYQVVTVYLDEA